METIVLIVWLSAAVLAYVKRRDLKKNVLLLMLIALLASCSKTDDLDFDPAGVEIAAKIETQDNGGITFISQFTNLNQTKITADIEIWYHSSDVYFNERMGDINLNPGITHIGTTLAMYDGVNYEIASINIVVDGVRYDVEFKNLD